MHVSQRLQKFILGVFSPSSFLDQEAELINRPLKNSRFGVHFREANDSCLVGEHFLATMNCDADFHWQPSGRLQRANSFEGAPTFDESAKEEDIPCSISS